MQIKKPEKCMVLTTSGGTSIDGQMNGDFSSRAPALISSQAEFF